MIHLSRLLKCLSQYLGDDEQQCICRYSELLVALILDCTAVELNLRETQRKDFLFKFESLAIGLCYALRFISIFMLLSLFFSLFFSNY